MGVGGIRVINVAILFIIRGSRLREFAGSEEHLRLDKLQVTSDIQDHDYGSFTNTRVGFSFIFLIRHQSDIHTAASVAVVLLRVGCLVIWDGTWRGVVLLQVGSNYYYLMRPLEPRTFPHHNNYSCCLPRRTVHVFAHLNLYILWRKLGLH